MTYPLTFQPPIGLSLDRRPASAACTGAGCRWSETEPSESPDMQDALRASATAHALECENPVTITTLVVLTIVPVPRQSRR